MNSGKLMVLWEGLSEIAPTFRDIWQDRNLTMSVSLSFTGAVSLFASFRSCSNEVLMMYSQQVLFSRKVKENNATWTSSTVVVNLLYWYTLLNLLENLYTLAIALKFSVVKV